MSTKAPAKTQAKTPAAPAAARIPQHPVAVPEHEVERPDIAAQLEGAARLGHSLGAVGVDGPPPPIIQRQELPEEEEEELQLKREPAAVQRQELPEEEKEELQTKPANGVQRQGGREGFQLDDETAGRINRARGGGQPLEGTLQEQMSEALGHDFSGVRVHTDSEADELNQQLQAKAFTTGPDIFFLRGVYAPASSTGRELIAHELTHVVQQQRGRVGGSRRRRLTARPEKDVFEREAEALSRKAITAGGGGVGQGVVGSRDERGPETEMAAEISPDGRAHGRRARVGRQERSYLAGPVVQRYALREGPAVNLGEGEYVQVAPGGLIQYGTITSCIGLVARRGNDLLAIHLGLMAPQWSRSVGSWTGATTALRVAWLLSGTTNRLMFGEIGVWDGTATSPVGGPVSRFLAIVRRLSRPLEIDTGGGNFNVQWPLAAAQGTLSDAMGNVWQWH